MTLIALVFLLVVLPIAAIAMLEQVHKVMPPNQRIFCVALQAGIAITSAVSLLALAHVLR